ncbi:MAG: T9SS type A sorting domain-containing protein [Saprospiraceae bacterium]|nr:T9SS type A sorting domain-containing protein [Saprospiraceae bacterium]
MCEDELPSQSIVLYPNPASSFAYLDISPLAARAVSVQVYSNLGRMVRQVSLPEATTTLVRLELGGLPSGHYGV